MARLPPGGVLCAAGTPNVSLEKSSIVLPNVAVVKNYFHSVLKTLLLQTNNFISDLEG